MCKICKNETVIKEIGKIKYNYCLNCGFLCKEDSFVLNCDEEFARYKKHNNDYNIDYVKYQEKFFHEISGFLGNKALDFGCGNHHILADIINQNNINCNYYDLYFYPDKNYEKHLYDAIILEEVIEHIKDPLPLLKHLVTFLNDSGKLIIRTLLIPSDIFDKNWWYLRDSTHISFFDLKTFLFICDYLKLKIIYFNDKDLIILQKA